ncbi:hypothetical protein [Alkaliphilus crotonatoxidans]
MHYFIIQQDQGIATAPKIKGFQRDLLHQNQLAEKINILYIENAKRIDFIDFIDTPLLLLADDFKHILRRYCPNLEFKSVVLCNFDTQEQEIYWNVELPEVNCLSPKTEYYPDGTLKKLVIDNSRAKEYSMFQITNKIKRYYIVRLELAESILRRNIGGFILKELEEE